MAEHHRAERQQGQQQGDVAHHGVEHQRQGLFHHPGRELAQGEPRAARALHDVTAAQREGEERGQRVGHHHGHGQRQGHQHAHVEQPAEVFLQRGGGQRQVGQALLLGLQVGDELRGAHHQYAATGAQAQDGAPLDVVPPLQGRLALYVPGGVGQEGEEHGTGDHAHGDPVLALAAQRPRHHTGEPSGLECFHRSHC